MTDGQGPLQLRNVVHLIRPAQLLARDLEQLRVGITLAPDAALFYHTVQVQLRNPATDELPPDDLSAWVGGVVQDRETAERLSFAVQTRGGSPEELRAALIGALDTIPEKTRLASLAPHEGRFSFLLSEPVTVPDGPPVLDAAGLIEALEAADASVWFYHLVEEPWFGGGRMPVADWLEALQEPQLADWLRDCAREHIPLDMLRDRVLRRWKRRRLGSRVADAARAPEGTRREAQREAVSKLVRRMTRPGSSG